MIKSDNTSLLQRLDPLTRAHHPHLRMLQNMTKKRPIHELILQKETREPLHSSKKSRDPKKLEENFIINAPDPNIKFEEIWLFDDVLTGGTTFRAAHDFLLRTFPQKKVVGFFIARSVQVLPFSQIA